MKHSIAEEADRRIAALRERAETAERERDAARLRIAELEAPVLPGEVARAVADIRHLMLYEDPRSEDHSILETAASLLTRLAAFDDADVEALIDASKRLVKGASWMHDVLVGKGLAGGYDAAAMDRADAATLSAIRKVERALTAFIARKGV